MYSIFEPISGYQCVLMCTDVLLKSSFCMYKIVHNERCSFFANWKQYHLYPITVNLHKGPPPLTERKELHQWRKYILRAGGGGVRFQAQCRENVLFCPKSDESKKCLVLFYLFTLCVYPFHHSPPCLTSIPPPNSALHPTPPSLLFIPLPTLPSPPSLTSTPSLPPFLSHFYLSFIS